MSGHLLNDLAFRRDVRAVRALGDRPFAELVIALMSADRADMRDLVRRFAAIAPEHLHAIGGDDFPPAVFRVPHWFGGGDDGAAV
jgi:hypothetical protein